jgi:undecaprenyl-diphosphatase
MVGGDNLMNQISFIFNRYSLSLLVVMFSNYSFADSGPFGIDHRLNKDDTGIWNRSNQLTLNYGSIIVVLGAALWEGSDSRLGKTLWKATDAMVITAVGSAATKALFRRQRPVNGNNPDAWFESGHDKSFVSGEVAHITSIVTPFILEYQDDYPWIWGLAILPVYDGIARMKSQAHWQSDVLAGAALGAAVGYFTYNRDTPLSVSILPDGFTVGYKKNF